MKKKILSILLALVMVVGTVPLGALPAFAEDVPAETGKYINRSWDGESKKVISTETNIPADAQTITKNTTALDGGWYVVADSITNENRIVVNGTADNPTNIVLLDGAKLEAKAGIEVLSGKVLNIYGQSNGTGKIEAVGDVCGAGIGGSYGDKENAGTLNIYGGIIKATGGYHGAGIGGGQNGTGGAVNVYGGSVFATSGENGAGIGGGGTNNDDFNYQKRTNGGKVTVYGGSVEAKSVESSEARLFGTYTLLGCHGAGIGGGYLGNGGELTIWGGTVKAEAFNLSRSCRMGTDYNNCICEFAKDVGCGSHCEYEGSVRLYDGSIRIFDGEELVSFDDYCLENIKYQFGDIPSPFIYPFPVNSIINTTPYEERETNHGYLVTDKQDGMAGDEITVTVYPEEGYRLKDNRVDLLFDNENDWFNEYEEAFVSSEGNTHNFLMPWNTNATFTAEFEPEHDCIFDTEWTSDEIGHWHKCMTEGCYIEDYSTCGLEGAAYGVHSYDPYGECICGVNERIEYRYYDTESKEFKTGYCSQYEVINETNKPTTWEEGKWYVVKGEVEIDERITTDGDVKLILTDGCKLTVPNGISVNADDTLTIYAQSGGTGELHAGNTSYVKNHNAGIGGDEGHSGGTINIHDGIVFADSYSAAGIGGGKNGSGTASIYGGTVTASSDSGAGIGGGYGESGQAGTANIYGGTVTAWSKTGAGIGGGYGGTSGGTGKVNISGGTVNAWSTDGAGIGGGGGFSDNGGRLSATISGGTITARSTYAAGIGGGSNHARDYISQIQSLQITGGVVIAKSENGYGIGRVAIAEEVDIGSNMAIFDSENNQIPIPEGNELITLMQNSKYLKFAEKTPEPPTADDFTFIPPANCVYDGQPKQASVTTDKDGMGEITVKYQKQNGDGWDSATTEVPAETGKYKVVISVGEGERYAATDTNISSDSWVFEITEAVCTHENTSVSYEWGSDPCSCTASLVCDTCHTVLESETLSWINLSIKTDPATKCTEKSCVYFVAEFENELFGTVESEKVYTDPGPHHYVDLVCEYCGERAEFDVQLFEAVAPTCTEFGHKAYFKNSVDGLYYKDAECLQIIGDETALERWLNPQSPEELENSGLLFPLGHLGVCSDDICAGHYCTREGCSYCESGELLSHWLNEEGTACAHCGAPAATAKDSYNNDFYVFYAPFVDNGEPLTQAWYYFDENTVITNPIILQREAVGFIIADGVTVTANAGYYQPEGTVLEIYYASNGENKGEFIGTKYSCRDTQTGEIFYNHTDNGNGVCVHCGKSVLLYINENGESLYAHGAKKYTTGTTTGDAKMTTLDSGWYYVDNDINSYILFGEPLVINGDVHLILKDNSHLITQYGIVVSGNSTLHIYSQSFGENMGKITADCSNLSLSGMAGIGGGIADCDAGTLIVNGGKIIAVGGKGAAGIGGGLGGDGGTVIVNNGDVKATGGIGAPGIGGGFGGKDGTFTKNGGTVKSIDGAGCVYEHEHTFSREWKHNETHHWHTATCVHTDLVSGFGAHTFDENNKCTVCGYVDTGIRAKICTVILTSIDEPETVLYSGTTDGTNICSINNIANGTYLMSVSCEGAVTRTYTTEITDGKVTQEVTLYEEGDVNGDGEITVEDYSAAVNAALGVEKKVAQDLSETADYQKAAADIDKDGYVDVIDATLLERKLYY